MIFSVLCSISAALLCLIWWAGFQLRGERVDRAPWLDPPPTPPKKAQLTGPQKNPTETDPQAPKWPGAEIRQMKWESWNQRVEGVQKKHHLLCFWWGGEIDHFQRSKKNCRRQTS